MFMADLMWARKFQLLQGGLSTADESATDGILHAPDLQTGIPLGTVVGLSGPFKTDWLIQFLKIHPQFKTFWADRDEHISLSELHRRGLNLNRMTFGTWGEDSIIPMRRVLQSQRYQVIIAQQKFSETSVLKALQTDVKKTKAVLFLVNDRPSPLSAAFSLKLDIRKIP